MPKPVLRVKARAITAEEKATSAYRVLRKARVDKKMYGRRLKRAADKEAAKKVAEAAKKNKDKKKKKEVIAQSLVMFEVKPADSETDLDKVAQEIFKIKMDGCYWKT